MVSSFTVFFIIAFYFYFKQHYEKLITAKIEDPTEQELWSKKLKRKLMIFPAGVIAIFLLYGISFTLMNLYPDVDNVKSSRRVVDIVAALMVVAVFFIDKRDIDKKINVKKKREPRTDLNEPGIDIPEDIDIA